MRRWAERPLTERDRRRAFGLTVALLVTVAAVLTLTADPAPDTDAATTPTTATTATTLPAAASAPPVSSDTSLAGARREVPARVIGHARRFLISYLPYLYGQRPARSVVGASAALRRRLAVNRPRVPVAARRRRPRVVELDGRPAGSGRWVVTARISDGDAVAYPIELLIFARDRALVVTQTGRE